MKNTNSIDRFYRNLCRFGQLKKYTVKVEETDLFVISKKYLKKEIEEEVIKQRAVIKNYIAGHPEFYTSLSPVQCKSGEEIIKLMCTAGEMTETGPMACVAGAIAEIAGKKNLPSAGEIFIENGGDIFAKMDKEFIVGVYAGKSPFSCKIGLKIEGGKLPVGIATSSGTVGHSFSRGKADAVTVISKSAALSDGSATYFGNMMVKEQIEKELLENELKKFPFIEGLLAIKGREMFLWGEIELVSF